MTENKYRTTVEDAEEEEEELSNFKEDQYATNEELNMESCETIDNAEETSKESIHSGSIDKTPTNNKERMLLRAQKLLHSIYNSILSYTTQQEISDAIKLLEEADKNIKTPKIDITSVKPPPINSNTKGRKRGPKSSTERLKIASELYEESLKKKIQNKEKEDKKKEEYENKKRVLELEERHIALEQKKRKLTVLVKDDNGSLVNNTNTTTTSESLEIKKEHEPSKYDR